MQRTLQIAEKEREVDNCFAGFLANSPSICVQVRENCQYAEVGVHIHTFKFYILLLANIDKQSSFVKFIQYNN